MSHRSSVAAVRPVAVLPAASTNRTIAGARPLDWREGLPVLTGLGITMREVRMTDAPALFARLTTAAVSRFISPPPSSVERFERFIEWTHRQRAAGLYMCFAVVAEGADGPVGLFRIRQLVHDHSEDIARLLTQAQFVLEFRPYVVDSHHHRVAGHP